MTTEERRRDLYDRDRAIEARDYALARVDENADPEWKDYADAAIVVAARRGGWNGFIADDVWIVLDEWQIARPREGRALGSRMRAAAIAGTILRTGEFRDSDNVRHHRSPKRVWKIIR